MTCLPDIVLQSLLPFKNHDVVMAFSGGIDSTVLLHCMVMLRDQGAIKGLRAVHVHHGLSDQADQWAEHCLAFCAKWSVTCEIVRVCVETETGTGLEQAARSARYQVFEKELGSNDCLVQGHHQDDQAETVLFRLFRGAGIDGLAGIPVSRPLGQGTLLRPLLSVSRAEIVDYVRLHELTHIDDASNDDLHFSRNYIRHALLPEIDQRWPGVASRLASLANECHGVQQQLGEVIAEQTAIATTTKPEWLLGHQPLLVLSHLQGMSEDLQQQVVRHWLKQQSLPVPGREMLVRLFNELIRAKEDASPLICWPGCEVRRYQGMLVASSPLPPFEKGRVVFWDWQKERVIQDNTFGRLTIKTAESDSLQRMVLPEVPLSIKTRDAMDPSLKVAIAGRQGRKTIKRWLQEYQIPPWLRSRVPFVFSGEQMVCLPGVWVCEGFQSVEGRGSEIVKCI